MQTIYSLCVYNPNESRVTYRKDFLLLKDCIKHVEIVSPMMNLLDFELSNDFNRDKTKRWKPLYMCIVENPDEENAKEINSWYIIK